MPISQIGSHPLADLATVSAVHHTETPAVQDCHEATAEPLQKDHAHLALHEAAVQQTDCQDALCQLCGVCHQGLSLTAWPVVLLAFQVHPLPVSASWVHLARTSAPLTKPPIS